MEAILELIPYVTSVELSKMPGFATALVIGVSCRYACVDGEGIWARYAVFEESDCPADPATFIELARRASIEAFGEDRVAMIVRTRKGYHIYLDAWCDSFFEALLQAARFRNALPCLCRETKHLELALRYFGYTKWERFVLRVSLTKYPSERMEVIYLRKPSDPCHARFVERVAEMVSASYANALHDLFLEAIALAIGAALGGKHGAPSPSDS